MILAGYMAGVLWVYSERGWGKVNEIIRIPVIDYLPVIVLAALFGAGLWAWRKLRRQSEMLPQQAAAGD